jgi:hypothetical protein
MASIPSGLRRIKQDIDQYVSEPTILFICQKVGYRWRQRKLGPVQTVHWFILQVLNFNTAMSGLRHLSDTAVTASAYCKARKRLPLAVLTELLTQSSAAMRQVCGCSEGLWCGLRAYLVDGSSTIAPDTPSSQKHFGQPRGCKRGCGFPVPKVLGLFDAFTGLLVQSMGFPLYTHEQSKVWKFHPLLGAGDLLVGDRGFCSFVHLSMLFSRGIYGLFRIHQRQIVDFRPHRQHRRGYGKRRKGKRKSKRRMPHSEFIKRLGRHDQIVQWFRPVTRPKWMNKKQFAQIPESLQVREVRFMMPRKGQRTVEITLATTLLDPALYPKEKIVALYGVRWRVETHFAQLKTTLKMRKLKSQTAQGVLKELAIFALVYNLIHLAMLRAARRQQVDPDRISFLDTVRWLLGWAPVEELTDLLINPRRPDRHEPRVVKDREDTYTKMTRPRAQLRNELFRKGVTVKGLK